MMEKQEKLLHQSSTQPIADHQFQSAIAQLVCNQDKPQIVAEEDPVAMLAIPLVTPLENRVAMATFVTRKVKEKETLPQLPSFGLNEDHSWVGQQQVWEISMLEKLSTAVHAKTKSDMRAEKLENDVEKVSTNLASTYEEISLLYQVSQNLRVSDSDEELGENALEWLMECLDVEGAAIQYLPLEDEPVEAYDARDSKHYFTSGDVPLDSKQVSRLIETLGLVPGCSPLVLNQNVTGQDDWEFPEVNELIVASLSEGSKNFGWLVVFNSCIEEELGTVEASLINSLSAILSIHSSNCNLYRQQQEFLASVVLAMTSAIDAKDPYTCGHSDRVARFSVRLAKELGHDVDTLNRIYMGGLLHDIGKIGIDDAVLRKPGRLTDTEFEHIKMHPEFGYRILEDIKQLKYILPMVLHHHEQWNGKGYPHGLKGEETPALARIMAVADAYDAMTSDRPYRKGMPN